MQGGDPARRAIQWVLNTAALVAASQPLDDFLLLRARGTPPSGGATRARCGEWRTVASARSSATPGSAAAAALAAWSGAAAAFSAVQDAAEHRVVAVVTGEAAEAVAIAKGAEWLPQQPPRSAGGLSPWADTLRLQLQAICHRLMTEVHQDPAVRMVRLIVRFCGTAIMNLLADGDSGVQEYNLFAVFRLHADVAGLQQWADSFTPSIPRLREELEEPAQFCDMVATNAVEEVADRVRLAARFPQLQPIRTAEALRRFREVDSRAFGSASHPRMPKNALKRKVVEAAVKKLRTEPP